MSKDSATVRPRRELSQRFRLYFAAVYVALGVLTGGWFFFVGAAFILVVAGWIWRREHQRA